MRVCPLRFCFWPVTPRSRRDRSIICCASTTLVRLCDMWTTIRRPNVSVSPRRVASCGGFVNTRRRGGIAGKTSSARPSVLLPMMVARPGAAVSAIPTTKRSVLCNRDGRMNRTHRIVRSERKDSVMSPRRSAVSCYARGSRRSGAVTAGARSYASAFTPHKPACTPLANRKRQNRCQVSHLTPDSRRRALRTTLALPRVRPLRTTTSGRTKKTKTSTNASML